MKPTLALAAAHALALALLAAPSGCSRSREEPAPEPAGDPQPKPMGADEAERGRQACQGYADRVCDCALAQPDLAGKCDLARTVPDALDLNLRAATAQGNATARDRASIIANARSIVRACIEDTSALSVRGCSISEPPESRASRAPAAGTTARPVAPEPAPAPTR